MCSRIRPLAKYSENYNDRHGMKRFVLGILWCCVSALMSAHTLLGGKLDTLIHSSSFLKTSEVGLVVYDLTDNRELYSYQADKLYRPASIEKVITAVTALSTLGKDYQFQTRLAYDGEIRDGVLDGDLYVIGGFDPEFMEQDMKLLSEAVADAGIISLQGRLVGDVSMMDSIYWGTGWAWDDTPEPFQPYLSPLMLNRGCVSVTVTPTVKGDTGSVKIVPESDFYQVENRSVSYQPSAGQLSINRNWLENGNVIQVSGCVSAARGRQINMFDPKSFFMQTFCYQLQKQGISVNRDSIGYSETPEDAQVIYTCRRPLELVMRRALKESDNLCAEALFRHLGLKNGASASRLGFEESQRVVNRFMSRALGFSPADYKIVDGSGVSLYNYVSPNLILAYLNYAYRHPEFFEMFYEGLPVAGMDGTLRYRMGKGKTFRNVHAKTGTVTGVCSLAGYVTAGNGHKLSFVIINQNVLKARLARKFQDEVCTLLSELD